MQCWLVFEKVYTSLFQIAPQDLQYLEILGHGNGGTVYRYCSAQHLHVCVLTMPMQYVYSLLCQCNRCTHFCANVIRVLTSVHVAMLDMWDTYSVALCEGIPNRTAATLLQHCHIPLFYPVLPLFLFYSLFSQPFIYPS